jgi:hypothetical protein
LGPATSKLSAKRRISSCTVRTGGRFDRIIGRDAGIRVREKKVSPKKSSIRNISLAVTQETPQELSGIQSKQVDLPHLARTQEFRQAYWVTNLETVSMKMR